MRAIDWDMSWGKGKLNCNYSEVQGDEVGQKGTVWDGGGATPRSVVKIYNLDKSTQDETATM